MCAMVAFPIDQVGEILLLRAELFFAVLDPLFLRSQRPFLCRQGIEFLVEVVLPLGEPPFGFLQFSPRCVCLFFEFLSKLKFLRFRL